MTAHLLDWLEVLVRWLHITAGAAWIGASFYFNWLNNNLRPPETDDVSADVKSDLWAVHGGAFYRVLKYRVAPTKLPSTLHWFKWESYVTWISGFALLALVYFIGADLYLVDPQKADLSAGVASAIGTGVLIGGWIVYDLMCKSPLVRKPVAFALLSFALTAALGFGLTEIFSSRGAYVLVGAMLGTCMAANVFFVIIPKQRVMVDAMIAGGEPDGAAGAAGALRSLHNNYMTLPVLFIMISNHYPHTYGHAWDWAILAALAFGSAGVRHWFNLHGQGRRNVWILPAVAVAMVALALVSAPKGREAATAGGPVPWSKAQSIVHARCTVCHAAQPTFAGIVEAPKGLLLDSPDRIRRAAPQIKAQSVDAHTMPLANLTKMTPEERAALGRWIADGAKVD